MRTGNIRAQNATIKLETRYSGLLSKGPFELVAYGCVPKYITDLLSKIIYYRSYTCRYEMMCRGCTVQYRSNPGNMCEIMQITTALTKTDRTQEMCSRSCRQHGSHQTNRTQDICTRSCRQIRLSPNIPSPGKVYETMLTNTALTRRTEPRKCVQDHAHNAALIEQIEPREYVRGHADYYGSHRNIPNPGNVYDIMLTDTAPTHQAR